MKLSEVLDLYLLTSVNEGVNLVRWSTVHSAHGTSYLLRYVDEDLGEYEAIFDDQEIIMSGGTRFVVRCDGEAWEFAAWTPAWPPQ